MDLLAECSERDRGLEEAGGGLAETGRGRASHETDCSAESQESRGGPRFPQVAARSGKEEVGMRRPPLSSFEAF